MSTTTTDTDCEGVMEIKGIAQKLFDGFFAESTLEEALEEAGILFESIGYDHYDISLEIHGVSDELRLTEKQQKLIFEAGFKKCYVNHKNAWETHYSFGNDFSVSKAWRVSYPHKRKDENKAILVEETIDSWPEEWFKTGYAQIVATPHETARPNEQGE